MTLPMIPIIDLHCDLLSYLEVKAERTAYDTCARCSIPQLREGFVKLQTMAVFTKTEPGALQKGLNQIRIYQELPLRYLSDFTSVFPTSPDFGSMNAQAHSSPIVILLAIENASSLFEENEPLAEGIKRLNQVIDHIAKPLYISLTWNSENRFGGGALSKVGLKEDGKRLLEELHQKHIAIDLSHASDALAYEIIDFIGAQNLEIPIIASHSNARAIVDVPRNLPDEIAREIFRRGGVIGLNFYHPFVGNSEEFFIKHLAHWLEMGGEDHIALGADFFYEKDLPSSNRDWQKDYFDRYQNSSCYNRLLHFIQNELCLSDVLLNKFAHQNALRFMKFSSHSR